MTRLTRTLLPLALLAAVAGGGCAARRPPLPTPVPGYLGLSEVFGPRDFGPLAGRHIVLDPGHGGYFRGALGPDGLAEADVNLGVALHLRGLLEWAGAQVVLTRSADYDFLAGTDSTLAADLAFRSNLADSLQPDVFISIHHNSTASRDPLVNETQTYYPLDDDGASLDLARAIHRHLVLNLEISPARLLPGNFHVLRQATVPAVLGEPAMLSNPVMEQRLTLAASQRLEAEAYFLGLLDYFRGGTPRWLGAALDTVVAGPGPVTWTFESGAAAGRDGPGPDPASFRLTRDGVEQPFDLDADGRTVRWHPDPAATAPALLRLGGRNLAGRSAPVRRTLVLPPTPAGLILTRQTESADGAAPAAALWHWRTASGVPQAGGRLRLQDGSAVALTAGAEGWLRQPPATPAAFEPRDGEPLPVTLAADEPLPGDRRWRWLDLAGSADTAVAAGPLPVAVSQRFDAADAPAPALAGPRPAAAWPPGAPVWLEAPGLLPLVDPAPGNPDTARTVRAADRHWPATILIPALLGRTIVLDPLGGAADPDAPGPLGTRGSDLNRQVAERLAEMLTGAGARVVLTRRDEWPLPGPQKVRLAGRADADLYLALDRHPQPGGWEARHHPGSRAGRRWAEALAAAAAPLLGPADTLRVTAGWDYELRHTACPALVVQLPGPVDRDWELLLTQDARQRAEARALLLAVIAALAPDGQLPPTLDPAALLARLPAPPPLSAIRWIEVDGNFVWTPPPPLQRARVSLDSGYGPGWPAPGDRHTLEIHTADRWQLWLLERSADNWRARLLRSSP